MMALMYSTKIMFIIYPIIFIWRCNVSEDVVQGHKETTKQQSSPCLEPTTYVLRAFSSDVEEAVSKDQI